ncbi:hypothetical protein FNF27_07855 [Cafeteria roenbergensis]|uniref:C2 domain-containing protein n=1 Tax=Cafeteria roenbergensis TaxID=33653 RepID=A0A5A8DF16_CAFRO|nr:hypothetical protein FNF27_07855 [Cafeteria roenbergensis]
MSELSSSSTFKHVGNPMQAGGAGGAGERVEPDKVVATYDILCATWNVGNTVPVTLEPWLPAGGGDFDVVAIAAQECKFTEKWKGEDAKDEEDPAGDDDAADAAESDSPTAGGSATGAASSSSSSAAGPQPSSSSSSASASAAGAAEAEERAAMQRLKTALRKEPSATYSVGGGLSASELGATEVRSDSAESDADGTDTELRAAAAAAAAAAAGKRSPPQTAAAGGGGGRSKRASAASPIAGGDGAESPGGLDAMSRQAEIRRAIEGQSPFYKMVVDHLGSDWTVIALSLMFQTGLLVAVRNRVAKNVRDVVKAQEATGLLRVGTNKGGVVVTMSLSGSRLCFVGAHLAAHLQHAGRRDQDVMEIVSQIRLGGRALQEIDFDAQFHHVFWMGDLNYRVDWDKLDGKTPGTTPAEHKARFDRTMAAVEAGDWPALWKADQLLAHQQSGFVFHGFKEVPLAFPPTFKVKRSAELGYKAKRNPSYCDRVLYKSLPRMAPHLAAGPVRAYAELPTSDHKPVSCQFKLDCVDVPNLDETATRAVMAATTPRRSAGAGAGAGAAGGAGASGSGGFGTGPGAGTGDGAAAAIDRGTSAVGSGPADPSGGVAAGSDSHRFVLRFTNLRGSDLIPKDWGDTSDPYIRFYSDPAGLVAPRRADGRRPRSTHVAKTLHPAWPDAEVPDLVLTARTLSDVAKSHLFLAVVDDDAMDEDDPMGQAVLPLGPVVQAALHGDCGRGSEQFAAHADMLGSSAGGDVAHRFRFRLPVTLATSNFCPVQGGGRPTLCGEIEVVMPGSGVTLRHGGEDSFQGCGCNVDGCCATM